MFQTQREDLQSFRMDVEDGQYAVYLYWACLTSETAGTSVYNLGNNAIGGGTTGSLMNVGINGAAVLSGVDIRTTNGVVKKVLVDVMDGKGITVNFSAIEGKTILNAIRIIKLN